MSTLTEFSAAIASGRVEIIDLTAPLSSSTPVLQLPPPFANTIAATLEKVSDFDDAAAAGRVRVADMRGRTLASLRGTRADDHFHPNEHGYASIADAFARALGLPE